MDKGLHTALFGLFNKCILRGSKLGYRAHLFKSKGPIQIGPRFTCDDMNILMVLCSAFFTPLHEHFANTLSLVIWIYGERFET